MADQQSSPAAPPERSARWAAAGIGLLVFLGSLNVGFHPSSIWLPALGLGLVLVAWFGYGILPLLVAAVGLQRWASGAETYRVLTDSVLLPAQVGLTWWTYRQLAQGSRQLEDPRSATVFLILAPGLFSALFAGLDALIDVSLGSTHTDLLSLAGAGWISRALGLLVVAPPLLVVVTPWLHQRDWVAPDTMSSANTVPFPTDWTWGELVETAGLGLGLAIVMVVLGVMRVAGGTMNWPLWGMSWLLVAWTATRQGLRGGALVASFGSLVALAVAASWEAGAPEFNPLQGNLLGQCCTALLVGASAGWILASEARYRQVVGHIPVILYSARLPRGFSFVSPAPRGEGQRRPNTKADLPGNLLLQQARVALVSPACRQILDCAPEQLLGPMERWLQRILPADRELVVAALAQLCLQKSPVTCEYRLDPAQASPPLCSSALEATPAAVPPVRWLRDTMAPHYATDGQLDGWEGVVEDISESRALSQTLRRTMAMLQGVIGHLPTGVFFVQGPLGQPILVNARARQLLGQREDVSAGLDHLPAVYRLHRPDGSEYPAADLPVAKALRYGLPFMANDIVVHLPDGRRTPLITWAAPVDLGGQGHPEAAVWVLEDLTALQQAESVRKETQALLRAVIETMAEGMLVQNQQGVILEANPAAGAILGVGQDQLLGQTFLAPTSGCWREDGTLMPVDEQPDVRALRLTQPVRNVVLGLPADGAARRWVLVNSMPLPVGSFLGPNPKGARLVTTFLDITAHRQAAETLRMTKEKYQTLVESLPLMVLQCNRQGKVDFVNEAAVTFTGLDSAGWSRSDLWERLIVAEDLPAFREQVEQAFQGRAGRQEIRFRSSGEAMRVGLAFIQPQMQEGVLVGATILVADMTRQRHLEEELRRSQRLELVGRLAGGVVHDFNNFLTVMMGLAALTETSLPQDHPIRADMSRILEAGEQAAILSGQLLAFGKPRPSATACVDLNYITAQSLKLLKGVLQTDIAVEARLAEGDLNVWADETQLKQVVMNLLINAKDAMPNGGRLTITTRCDSHGFRLAVQDTGQGMDEHVKKRIFEPFFTTKERGTGLGLAVVNQIAEALGGRIEVTSQPGQGTCMEVWLPEKCEPV